MPNTNKTNKGKSQDQRQAKSNPQGQQGNQQQEIAQPADLYFSMVDQMLCAEKKILEALPQIAELATSQELKTSLTNHVKQTEGHRDRLEQIVRSLSKEPKATDCKAIASLLQTGRQLAEKIQDKNLRDLAIIDACCKVEYFETSSYESLITMAESIHQDAHIGMLEQNVREEMNAARRLYGSMARNEVFHGAGHVDMDRMQDRQPGNEMRSMPPNGAGNEKETQSMRNSERDRDSMGRFTSDDDDRGYRGRGRDDDNEGRGWYGDSRGHSEAAREGWRQREGSSSRGRDYDDDRDYNRGRRGGNYGHGGWFGDPQGHSEASREGWRTREREGNDSYDEGNRPGWYGDPRGHSEAAREGWRTREREGNDRYDDDDNRPGWYGDP